MVLPNLNKLPIPLTPAPIPFVINPDNDEIINVDRYYDKNIDVENYKLATGNENTEIYQDNT